MKPTEASSNRLAYKWLTWCIVLAFGYYWIITLGLVIFGNQVSSAIPGQTFIFRSFARQNWRMFAFAKVYNRQMLFITRDIANPSQSDTTDLVQYLLTEKRAYAPFNNEEDATEKILYLLMNDVEVRVHYHEKKIKDTLPGKTAAFYKEQAIEAVKADTAHQQDINNILGYARTAMQQMKRSAAGKEYQLIIKHIYIPPSKPALPVTPGANEEILFISNYKPL